MDSVQYPSYYMAKSFLANHEILQEKYGRNLSNFNTETYEKMKKNLISFLVYYDDLSYTYVEELAKTSITDLVSKSRFQITPNFRLIYLQILIDSKVGSVGGQLGLFIGISFLSFAELFDLAFKLIDEFLNRKKADKKFHDTKVAKF